MRVLFLLIPLYGIGENCYGFIFFVWYFVNINGQINWIWNNLHFHCFFYTLLHTATGIKISQEDVSFQLLNLHAFHDVLPDLSNIPESSYFRSKTIFFIHGLFYRSFNYDDETVDNFFKKLITRGNILRAFSANRILK